MNIKKLIEQIGGRERLDALIDDEDCRVTVVEQELLAQIALAVLDAKKCHAVAKHYAGCKYPVVKMNSLEIIIAGNREDAEEVAEIISTLYLSPPATSVPDGWKLVPVEPTKEMRQQIHPVSEGTCLHCFARVSADCEDNVLLSWCDMLAAAPAPGGE